MIDQAKENLNSETGASGKLNNVKNFEIGKSKLNQKEIDEAAIKADELMKLEKNFETNKTTQGTEGENVKTEAIKKIFSTLPPGIKTAINQLNRPEAEKGIEGSYVDINTTIQNSDKDKNRFARFIGKIIKGINP